MDDYLPNPFFVALFAVVLAFLAVTTPAAGQAQVPPVADEKLTTYAEAFLQITNARNEMQAELALPANKTNEAQASLRERMKERISEILLEHGLAEDEYRQITLVLSVDDQQRRKFEEILARLEG